MTELKAAPHDEHDPASPHANGAPEQDKDDHKPRDSKGWDGKLRLDKMTLADEPRDPHAQIVSDPEDSDDQGPPPEQLPADEDLLDDIPEDEDEIELVHCKIADMTSLRLERFKQMKVCIISTDINNNRQQLTCVALMPASKPHREHSHTRRLRGNAHRSRPLRQPDSAHQRPRGLHRTDLPRPILQQDQAYQASESSDQAQRSLFCPKQNKHDRKSRRLDQPAPNRARCKPHTRHHRP